MFLQRAKHFFLLFFLVFVTMPCLSLTRSAFARSSQEKNWWTIREMIHVQSKKFAVEIHYQKKNRGFVSKVLEVLRRDSPQILEYFDYIPVNPIHIIVEDSYQANGSATVFPTNIVRLYTAPPNSDEYLLSNEDWIQGLALHELTHIIHMEQVRGVLKVLTTLFGSTGKLGGIVPRWFTEGIATWAETKFTKGGRLRSDLMLMEIKNLVLNKNFCSSLDCLDDPGVYPHGRSSYWFGAYFLSFLEDKKRGTLSCLIKANSDSIPFFLNSAFKECIGMNASTAFKLFRGQWRQKILGQQNKVKKHNKALKKFHKISLKGVGPIDWQKGFLIKNEHFYFHTLRERVPEVAIMDLKTKKTKYRRFERPIDRFVEGTALNNSLIFAMMEVSGPNIDQKNIDFMAKWSIWYPANGQVMKVDAAKKLNYLFLLEKKRKLFVGLHHNKWSFYLDSLKKDQVPFFSFEKMKNITLFKPFIYGGRTFLLLRAQNNSGIKKKLTEELIILDPLKAKAFKVFTTHRPLNFIGQCNNTFVFKNDKTFKFTFSDRQGKKSLLSQKRWAPITSFKNGQKSQLVFTHYDPENIYYKKGRCEDFFYSINGPVREKRKSKALKMAPILSVRDDKSKKTMQAKISEKQIESYPSLRHFLPHYWLIGYGGQDKATAWSAETSLSDPKERHTLHLKGRYYSGLSEYGQSLTYTYSFDPFILSGLYDKEYSSTNILKRIYSNESFAGVVSLPSNFSDWFYTPRLVFKKDKTNDIVSSRQQESITLSQFISTQRTFYDDLLQSYFLQIDLHKQKTKRFKSFWGLEILEKIDLKLHEKLMLGLRASYGKLYKSNFSSGVLYGGSSAYLGSESMHEFYGVFRNDIFGNEIFSGRVQFNYLFRSLYRGKGLFPIYLKELRWLLGADYINADRIILKNTFLKDKGLFSAHIGARLQTTLAYLAPVDIDIIFTKILGDYSNAQDEDSSILFFLKSSFF